jgi:hypothetical protein
MREFENYSTCKLSVHYPSNTLYIHSSFIITQSSLTYVYQLFENGLEGNAPQQVFYLRQLVWNKFYDHDINRCTGSD